MLPILITAIVIILLFLIRPFYLALLEDRLSRKQEYKNVLRSSDELIEMLSGLIDTHVSLKLQITYKVKLNTNVIRDMDGELRDLSEKVFSSLAEPFLRELRYYYTNEYIANYITKSIEVRLIDFMKKNSV